MSIDLTISHAERLVVAHVGTVGPGDFEHYFAEIDAADAMSYRKIIDLSASPLELHAADIRALARRVNHYASLGSMGAMAIVATPSWRASSASSTRPAWISSGRSACSPGWRTPGHGSTSRRSATGGDASPLP